MALYILASLFVFMLVIKHAINRNGKVNNNSDADFWEREYKSNSVRRKNIDDLPYITVPMDALPFNLDTSDFSEESKQIIGTATEDIKDLCKERILNLTGYTNTDLKLKYGTANITPLSQYDLNYTMLARSLQKWAEALYKEGHPEEALLVLTFELSTDTDITSAYTLAAKIYKEKGQEEKISELAQRASNLKTLSKEIILEKLKEYN